jgi:DNA-binding CsgD family transcriptional regulator
MPMIIPIFIIPDLLSGTGLLYPCAIGVSSLLFVIFLLLSPAFSRHLFSAEWSEDLYHADMSEVKAQVEKTDQFENLNLTPREKEIAVLLLQGLEIKQVAAELGIKFSTVNFHITNLHRKLGIGGRSELFARFGVDKDIILIHQRITEITPTYYN